MCAIPRVKSPAIRHLDDLKADPLNANRGTDRGRAALRESLTANGLGRSIVERGAYADLIAQDGAFAALVAAQLGGGKDNTNRRNR